MPKHGKRAFFGSKPVVTFLLSSVLTAILCCSELPRRENIPPRKEPERKPEYTGEAAQYMLKSTVFLQYDGLQEARTSCGKALVPGPHLPSAHNLLGIILWRVNRADDAKEAWEKAREGEPLLAAPWFNLGGYYLSGKDYPEAERCFRKALEVYPGLLAARLNLAVVEFQLGRRDKAVEEWGKLRSFYNLEEASINLFRVTNDRKYLSSLLRRMDAFSRGGLVWQHPEMMDSYFTRFVEKEKKQSTYLLLKGEALLRLGRMESARTLLTEALRYKETLAEAHYLLGKLYMDAGRYENALEELTASLKAGFADPDLFLALADIYRRRQDWVAVEAMLRGGLRTVRDELSLIVPLGEALLRLGRRTEALQYLEMAASRKPEDFQAHILLGELYKEEGKWAEAAEALEKALQINGQSAEAWYRLGKARFSIGNLGRAEEAFRKCLSLDGSFPMANFSLGQVLYMTQRFEEAIPYIEAALKINPDEKEARDLLMKAYCDTGIDFEALGREALEKGELALAVENFEKALYCTPDRESLAEDLARAAGTLGMRLMGEENLAGAEKYLRKAASAAPHLIEYRFVYVQALLGLYDLQGAQKELSRLREMDPENPKVWELSADVLWSRKRYQESIPFLQEALRRSEAKQALQDKLDQRSRLLQESLWMERAKNGTLIAKSKGEVTEFRQMDIVGKPDSHEEIDILGGAFLISPDGHCITSYRLAVGGEARSFMDDVPLFLSYNAGTPILTLHPGWEDFKKIPATVLASDKERDLALLQFSYFPDKGELEFLRLGIGSAVRSTHVVYALGFPAEEALAAEDDESGPQVFIARGTVMSRQKLDTLQKKIEIFNVDLQMRESHGGSPVVDEEGKVVGMLTWSLTGSESELSRYSVVISVDEIKAFLREAGYGKLLSDFLE